MQIQSLKMPPVLYLVYNRPDLTEETFQTIRSAKPKHLFICADGAKNCKEDEELCERVKLIVTSQVDWDCNVKYLFRDRNWGCTASIVNAITWFFENVDEGIILEDDCLPTSSFFKFCGSLLDQYRHNTNVCMINGSNFLGTYLDDFQYLYSRLFNIWGWATWKDRWAYYSDQMDGFGADVFAQRMSYFDVISRSFLMPIYEQEFRNPAVRTWGVQWRYTCLMKKWVSVAPTKNLIRNIGMGHMQANRQKKSHIVSDNPCYELEFPLALRSQIEDSIEFDTESLKSYYSNKPS